MSETDVEIEARTPTGMPRWVKVLGAIIIVGAILFGVVHFTGIGHDLMNHGSMNNMHMQPTQQEVQQP